jgi:predicted AAA+ superfamily ATPase
MVNRETYMQILRSFMDKKIIKVLTGIRRSGKSFMLQIIRNELIEKGVNPENIISFNFESVNTAAFQDSNSLYSEVKSRISSLDGRVYLFFDEVQEVKDWEKCVNSFQVDFDADIYITGSNAKLLSGELATMIAGRYIEVKIYPFSYKEFISAYKESNPSASDDDIFKQYVLFGGMPFLMNLNYNEVSSRQYLNDIYTSIILKDVMLRNKIRDLDLLERIILYIMANIGQTFSATSLSKYFKNEGRVVAPETIINHIRACEYVFLFHKVKRQDVIGKRILQVNEKYYMTDHGFREAVFGNNQRDIGLILENIVYMELLRRGYKISVGRVDNDEIDFVCEKHGDRVYIQVAYIIADAATVEREFGSLLKVNDNYPKYVISTDEFDLSRSGIQHINIKKFLLSE